MLGQGQPGSNARVKIPQKVLQNSLSQAWNYCHVAVELGSRGLFLVVFVGMDAVLGVVLESQGSSPHIRECLIVWDVAALSQMVLGVTKAADTVWRRVCVP